MTIQYQSPRNFAQARSRVIHSLWITLLLCQFFCYTLAQSTPATKNWQTPTYYQDALLPSQHASTDQLTPRNYYQLEYTLKDLNTLTATQTTLITNHTNNTLDSLYFYLFPTLLASDMNIQTVQVNGQDATFDYEHDNAVLVVMLETALAPEEKTNVQLTFTLGIPSSSDRNYGLLASDNGLLSLAHAYALLAVYDDGWNVTLPPSYGDLVYAESSYYHVTIHAPEDLTIISSGSLKNATTNNNTQTLEFIAGPVRDFYVIASDRFDVLSQQTAGVTINSYYVTDVQRARPTAQNVLDYASDALELFNALLGPYPYAELDIAPIQTQALGIEFPGLIAMNAVLYEGQSSNVLEGTVVHEVAHQWVYGLIGSDQVTEPWLDESLAQYLTWRYFEAQYGDAGYRGFQQSLSGRWARVLKQDIPIGKAVSEYTGVAYGAIIYGLGPLVIEDLSATVGHDVFDDFLKDYYQKNKYGLVTTELFQQQLEARCACDLNAFFQEHIKP